ncbi:hypothetical protein [Streptomyces sp. Root369]|uniref:hypothetical protein n=1 Tax=Streptomyces sp. Root369 TaxID=1736523 RepID=UPI00070A2174|nr:hypothetical protein [Streptomyces sp. Root369]KQW13554.1 hypothetical protein ASD08_30790 [Streptomyces sp. Root369]
MNQFATTARRLGLAAEVFDRHARHEYRSYIDIVTNGFRLAAGAFEDTAPCAPGELPEEVCDAVAALEAVMGAHDYHLSAALIGYAIAPVTDEVPPMASLSTVSEELARKDFMLRNRRRTLLRGGALDSLDDETVSWALRSLATVHYLHDRLAAEAAADSAKPGNEDRMPVQLLPAARMAPDHLDA